MRADGLIALRGKLTSGQAPRTEARHHVILVDTSIWIDFWRQRASTDSFGRPD